MKYITGTYFKMSQYNYFFFWSWEDGRDVYLCIFVLLCICCEGIVQQTAGYVYRQWQGQTHKLLSLSVSLSVSFSVNGHYINRSKLYRKCMCVCGCVRVEMDQKENFLIYYHNPKSFSPRGLASRQFTKIHDECCFKISWNELTSI